MALCIQPGRSAGAPARVQGWGAAPGAFPARRPAAFPAPRQPWRAAYPATPSPGARRLGFGRPAAPRVPAPERSPRAGRAGIWAAAVSAGPACPSLPGARSPHAARARHRRGRFGISPPPAWLRGLWRGLPPPASRAPPPRCDRSAGAAARRPRAGALSRPYLSITTAMVSKYDRASSYGSVTIGTTSYSSLMPAGIMSLNSLAFLTAVME